ncbi:MAG: hypothetical protein B7Z55_05255 [Planctomycetales bacterium 12-60-4]|nr:MAG: hypothetical protein B7Z55_05255 [Planctomycetales bacterium 12-60-4]
MRIGKRLAEFRFQFLKAGAVALEFRDQVSRGFRPVFAQLLSGCGETSTKQLAAVAEFAQLPFPTCDVDSHRALLPARNSGCKAHCDANAVLSGRNFLRDRRRVGDLR